MTFFIGTPHSKGAGYYVNGLNLNVSQRQEADIRTCTHCERIIDLTLWKSKGAWCNRCAAPICFNCGTRMKLYGCENFLRRLEAFTATQIKYEKYLVEAGFIAPVPPQPIIIPTGL